MAASSPSPVALVTGATGFIGSHLVLRLVAERWEVHVLARPNSDLAPLEPVLSRLRVHVHDGSMSGMMAILAAVRPQVVFHLASLFLAQHSAEEVVPLLESNVVFATQLVEAMTANGAFLMVNTGTAWQHFQNRDYSPVCLYAATKKAFEDILQFYVETAALKVVTLKLHDTYGSFDPRPKLFALLRRAAERQQPLEMSAGEQHLDLVHVDDVVEALRIAAQRLLEAITSGHEQFVVSSGQALSLREVVRLFQESYGKPVPVVWGRRPYRPREVMNPWAQGQKLPGWTPRLSLPEGLRRMMQACPRFPMKSA